MAINNNPSTRGKNRSSLATDAKSPAAKPWSKRVQAAPKPLKLAKKDGAASNETDTPAETERLEVEGAEEPVVKAPTDKGKKRKSGAIDETAPVPGSSVPSSSSKAKPSSSTSSSKPKSSKAAAPVSGYHSTSDDADSSDDDDDSDNDSDIELDESPVDVAKLPTVAKDDASVQRKLNKAKKANDKEKGVLYLGRIPHGFYEREMKAYFEQFGEVDKVRLARNKKTGKSKHYAFLLLPSLSVAKIVAETMDNYLLLGHILRCKVIPNDQIHPSLWVGANRKWRKVPSVRLERAKLEQPRNRQQQEKSEARLLERQAAKKAKLAELGIDYDLEGVAYTPQPAIEA